ncbi:hypothetical protein [Leisingera caerulea]|uniref:hypothetical protein n=1 Tax=Leisingera caerulea TaxID=506591 RepID=UPI0021A84466|nr:hypothetical protein [Leisingera caerulea]UWQ84454.1 hypothetical protein K3726_04455 [Leisingera caerulea]
MLPFLTRKKTTTTAPSWWQSALSSEERETIESAFQPLGNISAEVLVASGNPSAIGDLVGHLKKEALRHLGYKLLGHADTLVTEEVSVLNLHFYWAARGGFYYRWRDHDDFALEEAVQSFQRQIGLAENAVRVFKKEKEWDFIPAHAGYRQLRIIEEKRGNLTLARALCEQAKSQGWADDWDKNIARLNKKIAKQTAI